MSDESSGTLANLANEERRFDPPEEFAENANLTADAYDEAEKDRLAFWEKQAERLDWDTKWDQVLDWDNPPFAKWFVGGKINAAYNCVDRHVENGNGDKVAFHWVGEPEDDTRDITYSDLKDEVSKAANALIELGVETGDRVAIYMPMIPETADRDARLRAASAPRTPWCSAGFSSDALANRLEDCDAKVVITSDGGYRRGAPSALKPAVDEACEKAAGEGHDGPQGARGPSYGPGRGVERRPRRVVARRRRRAVDGARVRVLRRRAPALRDVHLRHDRQAQGHPAHDRRLPGRLRVHALGHLRPEARHRRLLVHGRRRLGHRALATASTVRSPTATTSVMYEGTPDTPDKGRWWEICEKYGVTIFYTAPTAIRTFMKWGDDIPEKHDLSKLRLLGSVGESINPEAYIWYRETIGAGKTPDRRHLVADRDRLDHDQPAARRHVRQARLGDEGDPRHRHRRGRPRRASRCPTGPAASW